VSMECTCDFLRESPSSRVAPWAAKVALKLTLRHSRDRAPTGSRILRRVCRSSTAEWV
jgi:hypothetical protein